MTSFINSWKPRVLLPALVILLLVGWSLANAADVKSFPPPKPPANVGELGRSLQRSMWLMATSNPKYRRTVKILFYGQSITEQSWSTEVANDLRARFTNANLVIENRAIGGFASQLLVKTAETDLYFFYPDLIIFHVYGSHIEYENIMRRARQLTTADILIQTDHITKDEEINEETSADKLTLKQWSAWMNHSFLPATSKDLGLELCDVRAGWRDYLRDNHLNAAQLLKDGIHLNDHSNYLMAELIKPYLRYDPTLSKDTWKDRVRTYQVGSYLHWRKDKLTYVFKGNRVDVVQHPGEAEPAQVLIDGKRPSEFPELYGFTRTTPYPGSGWPCILRIGSEKRLEVEDWTLTIKEVGEDPKQCKFEIAGTKTGPDGEGDTEHKFVSNSGRISIAFEDWNLEYAFKTFKTKLPPGFKIEWKVVPHFVDELKLEPIKDRSLETTVTLVQGLKNTQHKLELIGGPDTPISSIRIYEPPVP